MHVTHACYLDDASGAAVASRGTMGALAQRGFRDEVLCGAVLDQDREVDPAHWLMRRGIAFGTRGGGSWSIDARGGRAGEPWHFRLEDRGVPVTMHRSPSTRLHAPGEEERREFLRLFETVADRFRPDVMVTYGGGRLGPELLARAKARGSATVFALHNLRYDRPEVFGHADRPIAPSRFAAEHYRGVLGREIEVLPNLVDWERVRVERPEPRYVTFVNPSVEKGVYAFARIADELGRRRPDIPLLVVEARGTEADLAACGLDLRRLGTVSLMANTPDPRRFWRVARICLMPSTVAETQGLAAVEAMINGIPVVASDRGALPETLGAAGVVLPLPGRLTASARTLPDASEVAPWVEAVIRLWDDREAFEAQRRRALAEARRWSREVLGPRWERFVREAGAVRTGSR
ncbi:glycosyltransferase [Tautonia sp. JC769]|uniref:glycosyltransferase n=1 Tax=Tautonia sp. JC769 TaxID=3232135 RepID=UPI0034583B68